MNRFILVGALLVPFSAAALTADVGEIAVIEDLQGTTFCNPDTDENCFPAPDVLCRETAKIFFETHCDDYDGLVVFRQASIAGNPILASILNVQQGTPVLQEEQGIGRVAWNQTAAYGSAGRLEQCVSMAGLYSIPDNPEDRATALLGIPMGISGLELLAHEYGHHWLLSVQYDQDDGNGPQGDLRGYESGPNQHYSARVHSESVMYGSFITDNGGGSFDLCGGDRKFGPLDQYLMGLRGPAEVPPILLVDDGSGQGDPATGAAPNQCYGATGTAKYVTIDDIVRVEGPRIPAYGAERTHHKIAFVLVTPAGVDATPAEIAKVETYRAAFEAWWPWGTDYRSTIDTTLEPPGNCGITPPTDGGTPDGSVADGGVPDSGTPDAGTPDAGLPDGSEPDAGDPDSGFDPCLLGGCEDGGTPDGGGPDIETLDPGGCCSTAPRAADPLALAVALGLLALALTRRRR
ncbi:MAG: MYXO-CTERM sorting domain-containing protein [Deltaproteobacteria bacterium]|nr:MYXO-CTERM sorting domain-containing protein [Deltaproteobacteria bacterium]